MIMSYLAYKKPLPPDQIGQSLNEQMLQSSKQLQQQARIDEMFEMYEDEFINADELEPGDQIQFTGGNLEERKGAAGM